MGKSSLIIVLGMSAIVAFFILRLNANTDQNVSTTVDMFKQTQARLIANSGVEIFLEKLKADNSMIGNSYNNNNLFDGTYNIEISGVDTLINVKSTAAFMDVTHTSIVQAAADKLGFFPVDGAMYVAADAVVKVKINGNITVSGYDHDINGNILNNGNDLPGIAVDNQQAVDIIKTNISGSADIEGAGGTPSVHVVNNGIDWEEYALDVESNPDIIINKSSDLSGLPNLGTVSQPKTTFVNGDILLNSNLTGCGILVVNGNIKINGDFTYRGIIIAYKDSEIKTELNGNGKVYGAMIVAGESANLAISNGNFKLLYSQESLNNVAGLLKAKRFKILSWWE
jgi:hypothetical protein